MQFGESLGAEVALDVAASGTAHFDELGVERGPLSGHAVPDRGSGSAGSADAALGRPDGVLGSVSRAVRSPRCRRACAHVQVIHHDDPINKFDYAALVRAPWWMGPPETRPPGVPRETAFRPVITFIITLIDLKNGMNSKPGQFVRVGHDYRIELREAVRATYAPARHRRAGRADRAGPARREREWATRRMVASRFATARDSVRSQFARWGQDSEGVDLDGLTAAELARGGVGRGAAPAPADSAPQPE